MGSNWIGFHRTCPITTTVPSSWVFIAWHRMIICNISLVYCLHIKTRIQIQAMFSIASSKMRHSSRLKTLHEHTSLWLDDTVANNTHTNRLSKNRYRSFRRLQCRSQYPFHHRYKERHSLVSSPFSSRRELVWQEFELPNNRSDGQERWHRHWHWSDKDQEMTSETKSERRITFSGFMRSSRMIATDWAANASFNSNKSTVSIDQSALRRASWIALTGPRPWAMRMTSANVSRSKARHVPSPEDRCLFAPRKRF